MPAQLHWTRRWPAHWCHNRPWRVLAAHRRPFSCPLRPPAPAAAAPDPPLTSTAVAAWCSLPTRQRLDRHLGGAPAHRGLLDGGLGSNPSPAFDLKMAGAELKLQVRAGRAVPPAMASPPNVLCVISPRARAVDGGRPRGRRARAREQRRCAELRAAALRCAHGHAARALVASFTPSFLHSAFINPFFLLSLFLSFFRCFFLSFLSFFLSSIIHGLVCRSFFFFLLLLLQRNVHPAVRAAAEHSRGHVADAGALCWHHRRHLHALRP